jgi:ribosome-associated heat shock protein Hsp15
LIATSIAAERTKTRLDQWLWFARFVKSRSLAARLCSTGAIVVNSSPVKKANHLIRIGDVVLVPQGGWQRTIRVVDLGLRRGPAAEARLLYEEAAASVRLVDLAPAWMPLLVGDEPEDQSLRAASREG